MRHRAALLVLLASGCIESSWMTCPDGRVCAEGTLCDVVNHRCSEPDEECFGRGDGQTCGGGNGLCDGGACLLSVCGDGRIDGLEECDGEDLAGRTCRNVGFYEDPGLACSEDCRSLETDGCSGFCGDDATTGPEYCDPTDPETAVTGACALVGFSAGAVGCLDTCNGGTTDDCMHFGWQLQDTGAEVASFDQVWGVGGSVISIGPRVHRFDGTSWTELPHPCEKCTLHELWGGSIDDFWVAHSAPYDAAPGTPSQLSRWDGSAWTTVDNPAGAVAILGMWGSAGDDIFAVGNQETTLHYDGDAWTAMENLESPGNQPYVWSAVWGVAPDDVYAVGAYGLMAHYDGQSWEPMDSGTTGYLDDVWASAPDDLWVVAQILGDGGGAVIRHFDGEEWTTSLTRPLGGISDIAGRGPGDIWAVGSSATSAAVHFDGTAWTETRLSGEYRRVWVDDRTVITIGNGSPAMWPGAGPIADPPITEQPGTDDLAWYDIWGRDATTWTAVGRDFAYHENAGTSLLYQLDEPLVSIAGVAPDDLYGLAWDGTLHHYGGEVAGWSVIEPPAAFPFMLTGSAAAGIFVLGAVPHEVEEYQRFNLYRREGDGWVFVPGSTINYCACSGTGPDILWAAGPDDLFLVGENYLSHFDGTDWDLRDPRDLADSANIRSVWGASPDDVWALSGQTLYHFDGTDWTASVLGGFQSYMTVTGSAADDVFLVGVGGQMAHYDGNAAGRWDPVAPLDVAPDFAPAVLVTPTRIQMVGVDPPTSGMEGLLRTRPWACRESEDDCDDRLDNDCDGTTDTADAECGD